MAKSKSKSKFIPGTKTRPGTSSKRFLATLHLPGDPYDGVSARITLEDIAQEYDAKVVYRADQLLVNGSTFAGDVRLKRVR